MLLGKQESLMSAEKRNEAGGSPGFVTRLVIGSLYADHLLMLDIIVRIWTSRVAQRYGGGKQLNRGQIEGKGLAVFQAVSVSTCATLRTLCAKECNVPQQLAR